MPVMKVIMPRLEDGDQKAQDEEPSMYRHGLGTRKTERSSMSLIEDTINMEMFTDLD